MASTGLAGDGPTLSVKVALAIRKRGGRKVILAPDGSTSSTAARRRPEANSALVRALARSFRWQRMIESGRYDTIGDLARAEKVNPSYLSRALRLTLLAPDTVETILGGRHQDLSLLRLTAQFSVEWEKQWTRANDR